MHLNNNASRLKREILVKIARLAVEDKLVDGIGHIPAEMAPRGSQPHRCCIYHDREIIKYRVLAQLGFTAEAQDEDAEAVPLASFAQKAIEREGVEGPFFSVLDEACNACVKTHFLITNACQGCVARPCVMNCPKKAISLNNGQASISPETCVNCGLCLQVCPYHAVVKIPVPCEEACPVGAVSKDANGKERVDYEKCIYCGNCMRECPFGAMVDTSHLVDIITAMKRGKRVVALFAPAASAQFRAPVGQLTAALIAAGFTNAYEVALGADQTAAHEAIEYMERKKAGMDFLATSCCPAWVRAAKKHVPEIADRISSTPTPLHYTAVRAKSEIPEAITVFIGPCLSKRAEGYDDPSVDYVMSLEELGALFMAKDIDVLNSTDLQLPVKPSKEARGFAASGGVAAAVQAKLPSGVKVTPRVINGINKESLKLLHSLAKDSGGADLVEVMACEGGCIAGPQVLTHPKVALIQLKKIMED